MFSDWLSRSSVPSGYLENSVLIGYPENNVLQRTCYMMIMIDVVNKFSLSVVLKKKSDFFLLLKFSI